MMATSEDRDEDRPVSARATLLSALLGFVGISAVGGAGWAVAMLIFDQGARKQANLGGAAVLVIMLLIGGAALWGSARLKPWSRHDPVSPATKKTNTLFGLSGMIAVVASMAVIAGTMEGGDTSPFFSNSPVALGIAVFAIVCWLVSWAIGWWWYVSADELEQRASDVGLLFGGFLFAVVTPAWWVAARAGVVPQPNAMVLWCVVNVIWTAGWFWRRNR